MRFGNPVARAAPLVPTQRHPSSSMPFRFCDWRKEKVSTVKNQKNCSSCWAFAAVSNIEALWKIHRKINCSLSVQELVDCTYPSRGGCSGGYVWDAFQFVVNNTGLSSSKLYPYTGKKQHCQKYKRRKLTKIDGYSILPRDERYIAKVVATQGPVTALMNAKVIQHYRTGIIHRAKVSCDPNWLDHVVLIVGFGEGNIRRGTWSGLYWIIQNSWGKEWGEEGYFRMDRGSNTCGIAQYAATATVQNLGGEKPSPCPK